MLRTSSSLVRRVTLNSTPPRWGLRVARPRLTHTGRRVSPFARDYPVLCSDLAWLLYVAFVPNVTPALRVKPYRLLDAAVDFRDLPGPLWGGEEFAHQFAARDQALRRLLAQFRLAPCLQVICRGSHPKLPRDIWSYDPWGRNAASGIARNFDSGSAPHPRVWWMGATPSYG